MLAGVRECRCGLFCSGLAVSLLNATRTQHLKKNYYSEVFGGFSSIVAPPLISAWQKKHAIRAIIAAAARFLAVQICLLSGSGAERTGERRRAGPAALRKERRNAHSSLGCLQERKEHHLRGSVWTQRGQVSPTALWAWRTIDLPSSRRETLWNCPRRASTGFFHVALQLRGPEKAICK